MMGSLLFAFVLSAQDAPEKIVLDLGGGVKMEFVRIKAGTFTMGDKDIEGATPHEATLTKDCWMQTTETTQAQWEAVMGKNPSDFKGAELPVEQVSWEDCRKYLKKLNEKARDPLKGKKAGPPTEAQWEYACRAGEKGRWGFGDDEKKLGEDAWYWDNADEKTHPVGQKKANAWGLYDMHGGVAEWCEDWYEKYPFGAVTDPTGPTKGEYGCLHGECWWTRLGDSRSAFRMWYEPTVRDSLTGLRAALR